MEESISIQRAYAKTQIEGKDVYIKPPHYKPSRKNKNLWYFAGDKEPCQTVWEMGQAYERHMLEISHKQKGIGRRFQYTPFLVSYFYFLYLSGCRLREPTYEPRPTIAISTERDANGENVQIVTIKRVNSKQKGHPDSKGKVLAEIPIRDEWEALMWNYITRNGTITSSEEIFHFELWPSLKESYLRQLIHTNFRTKLIDPDTEKIHQDANITPHQLRHMRAYSFIIHREDIPFASSWIGWADERMFWHYAHIKNTMSSRDQRDYIKRSGLGNANLKVGGEKIGV